MPGRQHIHHCSIPTDPQLNTLHLSSSSHLLISPYPSSNFTPMAAQSGIRVPAELSSAFAAAVHDAEGTRSLVFTIEGGEF